MMAALTTALTATAMQGILDFLTADNAAAGALREQYVFKIVPMLNPDGEDILHVIVLVKTLRI